MGGLETLITQVGFPAVCCLGMGYFCRELVTKTDERITQLIVSITKLEAAVTNMNMALYEHLEEDKEKGE